MRRGFLLSRRQDDPSVVSLTQSPDGIFRHAMTDVKSVVSDEIKKKADRFRSAFRKMKENLIERIDWLFSGIYNLFDTVEVPLRNRPVDEVLSVGVRLAVVCVLQESD